MKKRFLSLAVALLLLGQMAPALAADPSNENPILPTQSTEEEFVIEDGKLVKYNGKATDIVVPDGVTEIGGGAFTWATLTMTSISLPDSVTNIESSAFFCCQKLTSFTIPAGVTQLDGAAICFCPVLYHVDIHDGVTSIAGDNFKNCPRLEQVYIPASVTSIGSDAFLDCPNLSIYGASGTRAETYAQEHNIPFVAVNSPSEVPAPRQRYPDVSREDWYYEAIETMSEGGLLTGYDNGNFGPNDIITKGQFATILCRIGGLDTDNANYKPRYFKQIPYEQPYDWATQAISSIWNTMTYMIAPESSPNPVLRGEAISAMCWVAWRMPQYYENGYVTRGDMKQVSEKVWTEEDIPDWDEIKKAAEDASMTGSDDRMSTGDILHAYNLGITQGIDENGTCNPTGTLTRAEVCQLLYNMGIKKEDQVGLGGAFVGG